MIRSIIWLLFAGAALVLMIIPAALCRLFCRPGTTPAFFRLAFKTVVPLAVRLGGCDLTISGSENIPDGPVLFAGNHQGAFDTVIILYAFGRLPAVVAKKEIGKIPVISTLASMVPCILIDRKDVRQSLECIKKTEEYLKSGRSVVIFPEGTRSRSSDMADFKPGALKGALKAKVPVVPFVIDGTYRCFEETGRLKKSKCTLTVLPPVFPEEGEKTAELSERVRTAINENLTKR